ncbi:MAG: AAA family ATPase [Bacteroidaceae bacterium]|nr:AAA family ATPase [Bacteroidaceae bacterium]
MAAHNDEMNLAWQFVEGTDVSVFLTGRAGTGKTTFLRRIKELAPKRMVVVAPTGVAAINARGATIHSFFQLAPGIHIPGMVEVGKSRFYQMSKDKKNILRSMDLLIIDEISMVRCDLLDAIDGVLRKYKDRNKPFGGVQLLLIGDLQQLAPVADDKEWEALSPYYDTPYFFSSHALQQIQYVTIELQHIYRQSDSNFVDLLGKIREHRIDEDVVRQLNARHIPNFVPKDGEGWIRLTTHNYMSQRYNEQRLAVLTGDLKLFDAEIKDNFPENNFPAEKQLGLKVGAQVMFLKNDPSPDHLYYNGKIGVVTNLSFGEVKVLCQGEEHPITVPKMTWENTHYVIDEETKEIKEEVDGTFTQYPLRLAWSITVHKSQGLTFDHAVLDINSAFAHGQVYVALSRCRSLEGLVLARPLQVASLKNDEQVDAFIAKELQAAQHARGKLDEMRYAYFTTLLNELFSVRQFGPDFNYFVRVVDEHLYHQQPQFLSMLKERQGRLANEVVAVMEKFQHQCAQILQGIRGSVTPTAYASDPHLQERVKAAANYFVERLTEIFVPVLNGAKITIGNQQVKKQYTNALEAMMQSYKSKMATMRTCANEGFTIKTYLKSKATSMVEDDAAGKKKKSTRSSASTSKPVRRPYAQSSASNGVSESPLGPDSPEGTEQKPAWKWYWKK